MKKLILPENYAEITENDRKMIEGGGYLDDVLAPSLNSMYNSLISVSSDPFTATGLSIGKFWTNYGLKVADNFMSNLVDNR